MGVPPVTGFSAVGGQSGVGGLTARHDEDAMRSDTEISDDVIAELRWDPQVPEPANIGLAGIRRCGGSDRARRQLRREAGRCPGR